MRERIAWALVGVLGLLVVAGLAGVIQGGPLDPPGPLGSTHRPISDIPPSWGSNLPANNGSLGGLIPAGCDSTRFKCVLNNNEGVLDMETGLVWMRDPGAWFGGPVEWQFAWQICQAGFIGFKSGWHLASIEEMQSLLVPGPVPPLPAGHPFAIPPTNDDFWTSTHVNDTTVRTMNFNGGTSQSSKVSPITNLAWCVRGGTGNDAMP
jgi:hypothetical protein